jgi:hypothetical protein
VVAILDDLHAGLLASNYVGIDSCMMTMRQPDRYWRQAARRVCLVQLCIPENLIPVVSCKKVLCVDSGGKDKSCSHINILNAYHLFYVDI